MLKYLGTFVRHKGERKGNTNILKVMLKIKNYFTPTPKKFRIIGDLLLICSAAIAVQANYFSISFIQISIFAGIVGKFITNFTTNE